MRAEQAAALSFILQDDIYLLKSDKAGLPAMPPAADAKTIEPVADAPQEVKQAEPVSPSIVEPIQPESTVQPTAVSAPIETPPPAYNYHGANKKQFLILTHYQNEAFIAAEHLLALQNILKRKEYEIDDIAILNIARTPDANIIDLVAYFKPQKLLILGQAAVPAGMVVPPLNQPKKMKNGVLLHSFSFDEMMTSNDNKKAFWEQMKNL